MSENETERTACPFAGQDGENINVKFFRGSRNDIITADEILGEARSAFMQDKLRTAIRSKTAPVSVHPKVRVREFVATLQG